MLCWTAGTSSFNSVFRVHLSTVNADFIISFVLSDYVVCLFKIIKLDL